MISPQGIDIIQTTGMAILFVQYSEPQSQKALLQKVPFKLNIFQTALVKNTISRNCPLHPT